MRRSITLALALVLVVSGLSAAATTGAVAHDTAVSNDTEVTADDHYDHDSDGDADEQRVSDDETDRDLDRENASAAADERAHERVDGTEPVVTPADPPAVGAGIPCWKLWPQVDKGDPCIPYAYPRPLP